MVKKSLLLIVLVLVCCSAVFAKDAPYYGSYQIGEAAYDLFLEQYVQNYGMVPGYSVQETVSLMKLIMPYSDFISTYGTGMPKLTITPRYVLMDDEKEGLPYKVDDRRNLVIVGKQGEKIATFGTFSKDFKFLDMPDRSGQSSLILRYEKVTE